MEQQQCPICMLYLLPGMNLQDHLDTHPKDMIIKALLSVKTTEHQHQQPQPPKPPPASIASNEMATVFLTTTPFNSSQTHIYQQSPPQQQHQQQQNTTTYAVAKRNSGGGNALLLGNRPYRLTLDASQTLSSQSSSPSTSATATFLNASSSSSSSAVAPHIINGGGGGGGGHNHNNNISSGSNATYGRRATTQVCDNDLFADSHAAAKTAAFRCIQQNTEQKNIMIVNTSSTQFSIQQTLPVKAVKPQAIELHPVIIDSSGSGGNGGSPNAISIIPRYTSEKYSGPPPSYESSVTNTANSSDKPRVIDLTLTQTPTNTNGTTTKMMEKQCIVGNNNGAANKLTTLSGSGADENRHLMITTTAPQKILEYTQTENGDFMITEKVLSAGTESVANDGEALSVEEIHDDDDDDSGDNNSYNVKFVELDAPLTFNLSNRHAQPQALEDTAGGAGDVDHRVILSESQGSSCSSHAPAAKKSGVKVISNVKLTSADISPTIKDIIKQYNSSSKQQTDMHVDQAVVDVSASESEGEEEEEEEEEDQVMEEEEQENIAEEEEEEETAALIQCTETLNLSKEKEETSSGTTSVIRKTHEERASPKPSTSKQAPTACEPEAARKPINVVFNTNPTNRLKQKEIYKQPKKLVVKLKKPLIETGECSSSTTTEQQQQPAKIKDEIVEREAITTSSLKEVTMEAEEEAASSNTQPVCKLESSEQFTVTFLNQHDYESIDKITVTPEIHHDSETNQSVLSMDLEPETSIVKREHIESELPIIVKTEMNSCSASSLASHSQNSSCSHSPGPSSSSRQNIESVTSTNESSPINFLYQNDRVRFSPPLSPYVYLKTFASGEDQPKAEADASWNNSSSVATQNSDQNSTCSRYTPSFDDQRSNYTDLDVKTSRNAQSTDSLNIRTDEKMPARGEISEQESNGEMEQPWHHPYFQLQAYPSSYDMNTAQECWNLSKADSQNACDSNNIQNVIINFPPISGQEDMKAPDLLKTIMQTVTKQEPVAINDEASGSNSSNIIAAKKNRSFRCQECSKVFVRLRARNRHMEQEHPHFRRVKKIKAAPTATLTSKSEASVFSAAAAASSSATLNWTATTTITSQQQQQQQQQEQQEVKVLSIIKSEPSTSAAVLVKNEMNRMLISTTGSIKMEMDRLLLEPSTSSSGTPQQISTLGLKIKRTYMCAKCNEQFRTLKLLDKHFQIHPAECTLCQKTFNSWNTFSLHLKHHLNIRVHACRYCPKRFVQRQRLVEHERIHTGHMPIKCPDCDERFRRYSNMLHHRARVHLNKRAKQEDYVCDCGEIFQTKAKLEWHQETHENKPKPCPYCRERFTHRNSLTRHIRLSHTEKYVFVKSKAVNCPICSCTYLPSSIKAHMATHQLSNKEYSCTICSKQFSTKWNLKQHHWTHANRSSKPFQCNLCPSAFVRETDYTTHMNAHRSIKPFTCNTCGKRFVRKYNWLRHSREHEREKKFTCEICNKKFHRAYYLTEHKRVHTGERPFSCTICGKTSATKTNHNKHIKIHHARDPLTAEG